MKVLITLAVIATALLESASARLIPSDNVSTGVTFYKGDPTDGGTALATARMNNNPLGTVLSDIENQDHVMDVNGSSYAFKTLPGGNSKFPVYLDVGEGACAISLVEALDRLVADPDYLAS